MKMMAMPNGRAVVSAAVCRALKIIKLELVYVCLLAHQLLSTMISG